jgi:hypothetical protein
MLGLHPFSETAEIIGVNLYFSAALIAASQGEFGTLSIGVLHNIAEFVEAVPIAAAR